MDGLDLRFIWFALGSVVNNLVHFHEAFGSEVDLIQHFLFHSDVMSLMITEECAIGTNSLLAINTDNFDRLVVQLAHVLRCNLWCGCLLGRSTDLAHVSIRAEVNGFS